MFKLSTRLRKKALKKLKQWKWEKHRVILTSSAVTIAILTIRSLGLLQSFEWAILDEFMRWRPREPVDERITIVGINETDLQKYGYPISDKLLAELLENLHSFQPRAIGLDIYRDLPSEPGYAELVEAFRTIPNLIGIEQIANADLIGVKPPEILKEKDRVGFNNILIDDDGKVRRGLLYLTPPNGKRYQSFPLKLALIYLDNEAILPQADPKTGNLKLGGAVFTWFKGNDGAYIREDDRGYQILANLRGPNGSFDTVSMEDIFSKKVSPDLIRDRLVLIGHTAASIKDFHNTSYSGSFFGKLKKISGVELQANFVSQILSAAIQGRNLIKVWPETLEWLWIFAWSLVGVNLSWKLRSPEGSIFSMLVVAIGMTGLCYLAFIVDGWWLPVVPPILGLFGSGSAILLYRARLQEEFKRSTEFLQSVIDAIPDPVFVKDINHRRIVLNQAYCRFIGYPLEELLSKTDRDLFAPEEAEIFWEHDESVFKHNKEEETEEHFTDAEGVTHIIASKRSIHKDGAGNVFLVGVIRDVTERKEMERQLKQLASELELDNNKLRVLKDTLQQQADRDPLTGLPNRKLFRDRLSQSLEWAANSNKLVGLLFLDLNGFKLINDTKGHSIGDLLLKGVAERLQGCLRGSDTVSRLGGDEFTVILPGIPNETIAQTVVEKIRATISEPFELEGHIVRVSMSIGVSLYPTDAEDMDALIDRADVAMYADKKRSKTLAR